MKTNRENVEKEEEVAKKTRQKKRTTRTQKGERKKTKIK